MNRKPDPPSLTVRAIRCVGVEVPMSYALGTSRGTITKAPLLLIISTRKRVSPAIPICGAIFPRRFLRSRAFSKR